MKIAISSDIYYPMTNGVAVFAHNLAVGLAKQGHEVMVLCPSMTGRHHQKKKEGVTTVYLRSVRFPFYPDQITEVPESQVILGKQLPKLVYRHGIWAATRPYGEIKKALDAFQPDVIHNQTAETIAIAVRRYAERRDIPMVSTGHAYPDNITGQFKLLKPIKRPVDAILRAYMASFLKHSEYATMPTEMAIEDLVPKRNRRFKVPVEPLSNGVDLTCFRPGKAGTSLYNKYKIDREQPVVLYVGRVDPEKSISYIVEAFAAVLTKMPDAVLMIVGDGTDRARLSELVRALQIEDAVRFLGKVMMPKLAEIYKMGTLFATASETETQGIVLIEAAATGLPLVAVDAGAVREICQPRRNGELCKAKDVSGLAAAMLKVLQNQTLRENYSKKSLEIAQAHDLNRTLARFVEIYEEAIRLKAGKES